MMAIASRNFTSFFGQRGRRVPFRIFVIAVAALLWLSFGHADWIASLSPRLGMQIGGELVEAVVVDIARPTATAPNDASQAWASVKFKRDCSARADQPCQDATTKIALPADVAVETTGGDRIPVFYLPGKPEVAAYATVESHLYMPDVVRVGGVFSIFAAFLFCVSRRSDRIQSLHGSRGRAPFIFFALIGVAATIVCLNVANTQFQWELGMPYAKRTSPSELTDVHIEDGVYLATYKFQLENGQRLERTRDFNIAEIDDLRKMKVGRKFDVVYLDGRPGYNRPAWVEAIHAPWRKLWIVLWSIATIFCLVMTVWAITWARRAPKPLPPQTSDEPSVPPKNLPDWDVFATFAGPTAERFRPGWNGLKSGRWFGGGICWPGVFLTPAWLLYRKMYGYAAMILALPLCERLLIGSPASARAVLIVTVVFGRLGKSIYVRHAASVIDDIKAMGLSGPEETALIQRAGGRSRAGAAIGVAIYLAAVLGGVFNGHHS